MKASIIKKMMTGVLAASLVMAPAMSVGATTVTGGGSCAEEVVASSTSGEVTTVAEVPVTSSVAGAKTTVAGVYLATSVNGSVVSTPVAAIAEGYALQVLTSLMQNSLTWMQRRATLQKLPLM